MSRPGLGYDRDPVRAVIDSPIARQQAVERFTADMTRMNIHVGVALDGRARCVCCEQWWPCTTEQQHRIADAVPADAGFCERCGNYWEAAPSVSTGRQRFCSRACQVAALRSRSDQ